MTVQNSRIVDFFRLAFRPWPSVADLLALAAPLAWLSVHALPCMLFPKRVRLAAFGAALDAEALWPLVIALLLPPAAGRLGCCGACFS